MSAPVLFSYLSRKEAMAICKLAEEKKKRGLPFEMAKAVGVPLLGLAGGAAGAFLAGQAADAVSKKFTGHPISGKYRNAVIPVLGAGLGLAYSMYKAHEMEDLRRAIESHRDSPSSGK